MSLPNFGKYRPVAELGQGGMADVVLALSQGPVGFNKLVVIKRLRSHLADDPEFVAMLVDEARLAARLNHPNIVHTNEVGEIDGRFFIAMEYLDGQPLHRVKRRAKRSDEFDFSVKMELQVICDVLAGLHYAHELTDYDGTPLNVVHRDVTPSNVFLTYEGVSKVLDFGIAKASGRTTETKTGVVKGKMTYMPPEQALGLEIDRRADVYSVGVMLWEAVAGRRMWKGIDDVVILGKLINGDVPTSPREHNPEVPEELDRICQRALAVEPDERYATAEEFQRDIEEYMVALDRTPSTRDIGRMVSELFQKERKQIKEIIEGQLSKIKDEPAASLDPVVIPDGAMSATSTELQAASAQGDSSRESPPGGISASAGGDGDRGSRTPMTVLAAAGVLAVGAGVFWTVSQSDAPSKEPAAASASAPAPPPAPSAPAKAEEVRVTLRALPAQAKFSIDGGPWLENPFVGFRKADDGDHEVVIKAEGHKERKLHVRLDKDVVLDVSLQRIEEEKEEDDGDTARPVIIRRPEPPPPPSDELRRPPPPRAPRELDGGDPWGGG